MYSKIDLTYIGCSNFLPNGKSSKRKYIKYHICKNKVSFINFHKVFEWILTMKLNDLLK